MKSMEKPLDDRTGFTLVELMIALVVITLVIGGYIGANIMAQRNAEEMHERTIALQDANRAIEQMRDASRVDPYLDNVTATFPDGGTLPKVASGSLTDGEVFNSLPDEEVTVSYASTTANPLDATVTVTWLSYTGRAGSEAVRTYITQR